MSREGRPLAIVCAVKHDWPTEYCHGAARLAEGILSERFEVLRFDGDPELGRLDAEMQVRRLEGARFSAGFFVGHGLLDGTGLSDSQGRRYFEAGDARLFEESTLVLAACLYRGTFPQSLVARPAHVARVVGYDPGVQVPERDWSPFGFGQAGRFQEDFLQALVQPLRGLVRRPEVPSSIMIRETLERWARMAENTRYRPDLRALARRNGLRLRTWPMGEGPKVVQG